LTDKKTKCRNQAGEPGGDELSESGVGGEGVVLELLHRGRAGPVAQGEPPRDVGPLVRLSNCIHFIKQEPTKLLLTGMSLQIKETSKITPGFFSKYKLDAA